MDSFGLEINPIIYLVRSRISISNYKFLFLLILGLSYTATEAAHLVGGQISYTCVGTNVYQIRLRIYRDCGSGGAQFDANANIAIYDAGNVLVTMLQPPKGPTINVPPDSTGNPCVTAPPGLCTEYAEYIDTVTLPPTAGGYTIVHQRCCRNSSIDNVNNSGSYGNTYTIDIPSNDTLCNNSAEFLGVAPIVLCLNQPINLSLNVSELDGDSLHFELCDILNGGASGGGGGGGCNVVIPNPPCPPPFAVVPFAAPYTSANPLPSFPIFAVDPGTGNLTGTPNQLGQYVMGICLTEYKNGMPISSTRLDYQFNVSACITNVESDMVTPSEDPQLLCDGLTVQFTSESKNSTSLLWDFGDPFSSSDTSTLTNPVYKYSQPGNYTVTLYADPGSPCGDTLQVNFRVKDEVVPDFVQNGVYCLEANEVEFFPTGNYPSNSTFEWDFGADANFQTSNLEFPPPITWSSSGKHLVSFTVKFGFCEKVKQDSVEISNLSVAVDAGADQFIDRGDIVYLSGTGGTTYNWYASDAVDFGNPFGQQTTVLLQDHQDTVVFYLRVQDELGCGGLDSLTIIVNNNEEPYNFISPNGDGYNDYFDLSKLNPDGEARLVILNRWGAEVWSAEKYKNNWTGVGKGGQDLPDGTYYYILSLNGDLIYKDAVNILRGM